MRKSIRSDHVELFYVYNFFYAICIYLFFFNEQGHHEVTAMMNPFGFGGFGGGFGSAFDDMFSMPNAGFAHHGSVGGGGNIKKTSISTRFANGKKITTKKCVKKKKKKRKFILLTI